MDDTQTETKTDSQPPAENAEAASPKAEVIDFWAEWCGPCKVMEPIFDEVEKEYAGKIKIRKINVDEEAHQKLVEQYNVMSIPTYLFLKDGQVNDQLIGAQSKETLTQKIDALLE